MLAQSAPFSYHTEGLVKTEMMSTVQILVRFMKYLECAIAASEANIGFGATEVTEPSSKKGESYNVQNNQASLGVSRPGLIKTQTTN